MGEGAWESEGKLSKGVSLAFWALRVAQSHSGPAPLGPAAFSCDSPGPPGPWGPGLQSLLLQADLWGAVTPTAQLLGPLD